MLTGPLPRLVDHYKLANHEQDLEGSVPLNKFTRLCEMLNGSDGDVHLKLAFSKGNKNRTHVSGTASTVVALICQNCMTSYMQPVDCTVDTLIVADESDLWSLEDDTDGLVCAERIIAVTDLVEDELILAVPMIPRHHDECSGDDFQHDSELVTEAPVETETTHRPFADLAAAMSKLNKPES